MAGRLKLGLQAAAVAVVVALLALLAWQVLRRDEARGLAAAVAANEAPPAPGFDLPLLDGEGRVSLAALEGKPVVLNFWASWCEPCKDEAPLLQAASERYGGEVHFLGVDAQDFRADARRFVERYGVTYTNVHDGRGSSIGRFGVTGFPETWFVDAEGRIVERIQGPVTEETLAAGIAEAQESS
jgi:cytochrome c biogenesis protein CcmG/thiol:disulfide interchange protein DsbE